MTRRRRPGARGGARGCGQSRGHPSGQGSGDRRGGICRSSRGGEARCHRLYASLGLWRAAQAPVVAAVCGLSGVWCQSASGLAPEHSVAQELGRGQWKEQGEGRVERTSDGLCYAFRGELAPTSGAPVDFAFHLQKAGNSGSSTRSHSSRAGIYTIGLIPAHRPRAAPFPASPPFAPAGNQICDLPACRHPRGLSSCVSEAPPAPPCLRTKADSKKVPFARSGAGATQAPKSVFIRRLGFTDSSRSRPAVPFSCGSPRADLEPAHETRHQQLRFRFALRA